MDVTTEAIAVAAPPPPADEGATGGECVATLATRIDTYLALADVELTKVEAGIARYRERWHG